MKKRTLLSLAIVTLLGAALGTALSGEDTTQSECGPDTDPVLDKYRYLRALSLDLRGQMPTLDELEALDEAPDVSESRIDDWLASDAFADQVVRRHHDMLWNNLTNLQLLTPSASLGTSGGLYYRRQVATLYRGAAVACLNELAQFTSSGQLVTKPVTESNGTVSRREGYVEVAPYWAPDTKIKVCGFDAQMYVISPTGTPCQSRDGLDDAACGCGPALSYCAVGTVVKTMLESFSGDLDRRVASVVKGNGSYLELFTSRTAYVNGPIVHYWRYLADLYGNVKLTPAPIPLEQLPDLKYTDVDTWHSIRLDEAHAGILTSPAYLLRFMTNRARANRFSNAFQCHPYQPPEGGLPAPTAGIPTLDLQERDGCKFCHAQLEPTAAYWGRWTESGAGYLAPAEYSPLSDDCERCALTGQSCSDACRRYYVIKALADEEVPYLGYLKAYEFRREDHVDHIERGPKMLVNNAVEDGSLPLCMARSTFGWLMGREPMPEEEAWIDDLSREFIASGYRYRTLVKAVVQSPAYRRIQ